MEKDFKFCSSNLNGPDEMKSSIKSKFSYKNNANEVSLTITRQL